MQIEIVNLNDLVKKNHPYRTLLSIIDFSGLTKNTAAKLFCNFSLISQTPDHSLAVLEKASAPKIQPLK